MSTYYNEFDPYAAQWLRNLIAAGHIAQGEVDERSICDVDPADLAGFTQCHFFAGVGVWSYALRLAGWPDDRPVWTGSCPCQPFSAAGKGRGFDDERHLWPEFFRLIRERRPAIVFGEQVASKDGLEWLDLVQADLEGAGYASAAADICAAGVGAPHIRQRLWWVADASGQRRGEAGATCGRPPQRSADGGAGGWMADTEKHGQQRQHVRSHGEPAQRVAQDGALSGVVYTSSVRQCGRFEDETRQQSEVSGAGCESVFAGEPAASPTHGHWRDADWLYCRDGKWRPVEPGTFPLAHGAPARVGRLRAYGNAIVPQVAQAFIEAVMEVRP